MQYWVTQHKKWSTISTERKVLLREEVKLRMTECMTPSITVVEVSTSSLSSKTTLAIKAISEEETHSRRISGSHSRELSNFSRRLSARKSWDQPGFSQTIFSTASAMAGIDWGARAKIEAPHRIMGSRPETRGANTAVLWEGSSMRTFSEVMISSRWTHSSIWKKWVKEWIRWCLRRSEEETPSLTCTRRWGHSGTISETETSRVRSTQILPLSKTASRSVSHKIMSSIEMANNTPTFTSTSGTAIGFSGMSDTTRTTD